MAADRPIDATAPTSVSRAQTGPRRPRRVVLVAAAGYGRTAALEAELPPDGVLCSAADLVAGRVPPPDRLGGDPAAARGQLVCVDDLDRLPLADQRAAALRISAWPDRVGVRIASRSPLPARVRDGLGGQIFERGPADLALTPHQIRAVLADEYANTDPQAPSAVYALTRGWPALVHFAGDALARGAADLERELTRPGSPAMSWLASDVLALLPHHVGTLLERLGQLDPITPDLVRHLCADCDVEAGAAGFEWLRTVGLLVPHRRLGLSGREGASVVPLVAAAVVASRREPARPATASAAASWYERSGHPFAAAHAHTVADAPDRAEHLVATRGADMLVHGDASGIVTLVDEGRIESGSEPVRHTYAEALLLSGDSARSRRVYAPLVRQADRTGWTVALAHRVAALHFTCGDLHEALGTLERVASVGEAPDEDSVHWLAARANVLSMLGRDAESRCDAGAALELAQGADSPRARCAAHQAIAKSSTGSRKQAHQSMALAAAREAGDVVAIARILGNQSYALLATARYRDAIPVCRAALDACELVRPMGALPVALHNLAEALVRVGDYEEARWHLERAIAICRLLAPTRTSSGLLGLGELHRVLGHQEQARAAYQEAITLAGSANEVQVLVPALAGLARVLAESSPDLARQAAAEAHRLAPTSLESYALTALGWVALASADRAGAGQWAARSVASARAGQAVDLLAEALELAAVAGGPDPAAGHEGLVEARSIWRDGGAGPDASRIDVLLGRLDGADSAARSRAREAARHLQRVGITRVGGRPVGEQSGAKAVAVKVLGGFEVDVDGVPVPLQAWRSRQARTLVKILASRHGTPTTRGYLCELLWPDDDPARTGHRLSVLLATVRGVLDPARSWPVDHYIGADQGGIWLDPRHVSVDAQSLLADAAAAGDLLAGGQTEQAREILADIDARYRGDAFADEVYEAWADGPREQGRAAWLRALRQLAMLHTGQGRVHDAAAVLVRLLAADPYDEKAHRALVTGLVRSGRHGEARRAFGRWTDAMLEVDAPPPDPAVLRRPQPRTGEPAPARAECSDPTLTAR